MLMATTQDSITRSSITSGGVHGSNHWWVGLGPNQFVPIRFQCFRRGDSMSNVAATAAMSGVPARSSLRNSMIVSSGASLKAFSRYTSWSWSPLPS